MRTYLLLAFSIIAIQLAAKVNKPQPLNRQTHKITFTQNKGQIHDQYFRSRPDIVCAGSDGKLVFHIRQDGISYQLNKVTSYNETIKNKGPGGQAIKLADEMLIYRVDATWLDANADAGFVYDEALPGYTNYYTQSAPQGVLQVKSYSGLTLKKIYKGIDLHYYEKAGVLKYDFMVAPYADYGQVKIKMEGAVLSVDETGKLLLKTPLGIIEEGAPVVYQQGRRLAASWLVRDNVVSFHINNYNPALALIIDPPTRAWGTYYGGGGDDLVFSCVNDTLGNVYMAGHSNTSGNGLIATSGAHQTAWNGNNDAFLAKLDPNGVRLWATYYGGSGNEYSANCAIDKNNEVYLAGTTGSSLSAVIATPGSHQPAFGGNVDAFLVKFTQGGTRLWATYYGGAANDDGAACATDSSGAVFLCGTAQSTMAIAGSGAHQVVPGGSDDSFLVKFNSSGTRLWATYYGAQGGDVAAWCATDIWGNVYLTGYMALGSGTTGTAIATPGSHQSSYGGGTDAYLVKFNANGVRQWATFYGDVNVDAPRCCVSDKVGNVYMVGYSYSSNNIASGGFQNTYGGGEDAFLVKFNSNGTRQWGTYYGGTGFDEGYSCTVDVTGNIVMAGMTTCSVSSLIATPASHQINYSGNPFDGFMAKFTTNGARIWGTYYGGMADDRFHGVCADMKNNRIYAAGISVAYSTTLAPTTTAIATPGSHQSAFGGWFYDGILARFDDDCSAPTAPVVNNALGCVGKSSTLSVNAYGIVHWYASPTSTLPVSSGTAFITPVLGLGTYTFYTDVSTCQTSSLTAIVLTVNPSPTVTVNSGTSCAGASFTILPAGGISYTYSTGSQVINPTVTTVYTVIGNNGYGCTDSATGSLTVYPLPLKGLTSLDSIICVGETGTLQVSGSAASYSWSTGQNGTVITVTPNINTTYSVTGQSVNGCINTLTITQYVDACLGLNNSGLNDGQIVIYPNPAETELFVKISDKGRYSVYDSQGKTIVSGELKPGINPILLKGQANGIYTLFIQNDRSCINYKISKSE